MIGRTLGIVGSGVTVAPLAAAVAATGADVTIWARDERKAASAARFAEGHAGGRPIGSGPLAAISAAEPDFVLESVLEDLAVKQQVQRDIEARLPARTVIATNTSSLPLSALASVLEDPSRFGGLHFLHPAHATAVVEVIATETTSPDTAEWLAAVVVAMGKRPIVLRRDYPGFVWNRIQMAVLRECLHLLEAGVADVESIDAAVSDALAPRWIAGGPFATADLGGIATFTRIADQLLPDLSTADAAAGTLRGKAASGATFHACTEHRRVEIGRLREQAIAAGVELGRRRASIMRGS